MQPLHIAAINGLTDIVEQLVAFGGVGLPGLAARGLTSLGVRAGWARPDGQHQHH